MIAFELTTTRGKDPVTGHQEADGIVTHSRADSPRSARLPGHAGELSVPEDGERIVGSFQADHALHYRTLLFPRI